MLRSAVANAESRPDLHWNGDDLVVATAYADEGPTLKRLAPARAAASAGSEAHVPHHRRARADPGGCRCREAAEASQPRRRKPQGRDRSAETIVETTDAEEPTDEISEETEEHRRTEEDGEQ